MPPIQGMSFIHFYDTHPSNHSVQHTPKEGQEEREEIKKVEATKGTRTRHVRSVTHTQHMHTMPTRISNKPIKQTNQPSQNLNKGKTAQSTDLSRFLLLLQAYSSLLASLWSILPIDLFGLCFVLFGASHDSCQ